MTAEQRLAAFLAEAPVPARDPAFSVAVMRRVARREFVLRLATSGVFAAVAAVALWACAPALSAVLEPLARLLLPAAVLLTLTAAFVLFTASLEPGRARS
jgi:hypothetical protein